MYELPVTYFRSSSYNAFDFCEQRYVTEYMLGWRGESNKRADQGTIVHKALELLACSKLAAQQGKDEFFDEEFFGVISSDYENLDLDDIISKVWVHYTTAFNHHKWTKADFRECDKWFHMAMDYNEGQFDPRNREIVEPEIHFDLTIDEPWARYEYAIGDDRLDGVLSIKGTIDLVTKVDDDTIEFVDWKTGQRLNWATGEIKTYEKLCKDPQLMLYFYALSRLYPDKDIIGTIFFIKDGGPFTIFFDETHKERLLNLLEERFNKIRKLEFPQFIKNRYMTFDSGFKLDKCKKFCHFGKNTFAGTHIKPLKNKRSNRITGLGETMTMCEQIEYTRKHRPWESVINNMSAPGHDVGHYKAPGSTND